MQSLGCARNERSGGLSNYTSGGHSQIIMVPTMADMIWMDRARDIYASHFQSNQGDSQSERGIKNKIAAGVFPASATKAKDPRSLLLALARCFHSPPLRSFLSASEVAVLIGNTKHK